MMPGDLLKRANRVHRTGVVLLLGLLLSAACGKRIGSGVVLETRSQRLVPIDTSSLAGITFEQLRSSSFYLKHQDSLRNVIPALVEQTGFDPSRNLNSLLLCWNGKNALVIGQGTFQQKAIEQQLSPHSVEQKYGDHALFEAGPYAVSILDSQTMLGGYSASVRRAIAGNGEGMPDELSTALRRLPAADQIWVASRGNLPFADVPMRSDFASILANFRGYVQTAAVGLEVDTGLHLRARVDCVSNAGSKRVFDAVRAGVGLGRLSAEDKEPEIVRVYDALRISQQGAIVMAQADLSPDLADFLFARVMRLEVRASTSHPH